MLLSATTAPAPAAIRDAVATVLTLLAISGLATRFILMPYLREHLVLPVREVQKQVTENHHHNTEQPTVLDRIEDLHAEVRAIAHVMDVHMQWSETEHRLMERRLKALRKQAKRFQMNGGNNVSTDSTAGP